MRNAIVFAAAVVITASSAQAATYGGKSKDLPAAFTTRLAAVCKSASFVLSASAKTADLLRRARGLRHAMSQ